MSKDAEELAKLAIADRLSNPEAHLSHDELKKLFDFWLETEDIEKQEFNRGEMWRAFRTGWYSACVNAVKTKLDDD